MCSFETSTSNTMDLKEILLQAQRLAIETHDYEELPLIERTLSQVLEEAKELHSRVTQSGILDKEAQILLGSKGIDLHKISQTLEIITALKTFEPTDSTN